MNEYIILRKITFWKQVRVIFLLTRQSVILNLLAIRCTQMYPRLKTPYLRRRGFKRDICDNKRWSHKSHFLIYIVFSLSIFIKSYVIRLEFGFLRQTRIKKLYCARPIYEGIFAAYVRNILWQIQWTMKNSELKEVHEFKESSRTKLKSVKLVVK